MPSKTKKPLVPKHSTRAQNLMRGALAALKAPTTPEAKRQKWQKEQQALRQIHEAISLAKESGTPEELAKLDGWAGRNLSNLLRQGHVLGSPLTSLGILPTDLKTATLVGETKLVCARLTHG